MLARLDTFNDSFKIYFPILFLSVQAYKSLARTWHPDKNRKNEEEATKRFKDISEAYAVLSNPSKRREYDLKRHEKPQDKPQHGRWAYKSNMDTSTPEFTRFNSDFSQRKAGENTKSRYRSTRRNTEFRRDPYNQDFLFDDFFKNDLFMDIFDMPGIGVRPGRTCLKSMRNPRSQSVFHGHFMGRDRGRLFEELEEIDRIFDNLFSFSSHRIRI